jgi:type IV pilus assembly protein PilW
MILIDKYKVNNLGFTLIELLMAMAITSIVSAGIFSAFRSQQKAHLAQKQTVEMQQNLRAGLYIMAREIRMAGYDPDGTNGAGIVNDGDGSDDEDDNRLIFTYFNEDAAGDGNNNDNDDTTADANETLQAVEYYLYDSLDDGTIDLGRRNGARLDAIAENISSLEFIYLDEDGDVTADLSDIKFVQITIEATTDSNEMNYTNGNRTLTTTVKCRNLGL